MLWEEGEGGKEVGRWGDEAALQPKLGKVVEAAPWQLLQRSMQY